MTNHPARTRRPVGRAFGTLITVTLIMLAVLLPPAAFGENPAGEMFKPNDNTNVLANIVAKHEAGTNSLSLASLDPKGDSWLAMQRSLEQFAHPEFLLRLFLSFTLAVACAWLVAWHPRRSSRLDSLSDLEERKTLVILGMVGAIVAELSGTNQTLAFVIFGIGALLRFRTVMDNPKLTGKAITVVVIGLACGMGSWTMASSSRRLAGSSFIGWIHTSPVASVSGWPMRWIRNWCLARCSPCWSPDAAACKIPPSTNGNGRWSFFCTSRRILT